MRLRVLLTLLACATFALSAQAQTFTSSNLPIIVIETDGQTIRDEPKVTARMGIIDNGQAGRRNRLIDPPNVYDGFIGIETRGASSQSFPKKQFAVETRDADGENLNVSLLGLPEENDWILYAPYSDKSLMRNVLTYDLARAMGRYASRARFCEVVLNGEYWGVYVLLEKIKRDKNRVDVNNLREDETTGDDLTGGYVFQIDRPEEGWYSSFAGAGTGTPPYYQYRDPSAEDIVPEQEAYIQQFIRDFEAMMASPGFEDEATGYPAVIDVDSFVDFFLLTELGKNVDGYRLSSFFHKDKDSDDPRLKAGPIWDFNLAYGNADYYDQGSRTGFHVGLRGAGQPVPFWWQKLANSDAFASATAARWSRLRTGALHVDSLMQRIDETAAVLSESQARNFQRWPVLGRYVWPNAFVGTTYEQEVDYLKRWIVRRLEWLDTQFPSGVGTEWEERIAGVNLSAPAPNPAASYARLTLSLAAPQHVTAEVFDVRGRRVSVVHDGWLGAGTHSLTVDAAALPSGVYLVRAYGAQAAASQLLVTTSD